MTPTETNDALRENGIETKRPSFIERTFGFKAKKFIVALVGVIVIALYLGNLLFGNASLEVLMQLEKYETHLKDEIARLKQENAKLQKEYFELKELEPSE
jgi:uncharacterized protein YlxW (UPF0749 family)